MNQKYIDRLVKNQKTNYLHYEYDTKHNFSNFLYCLDLACHPTATLDFWGNAMGKILKQSSLYDENEFE
ncbi:hypothetical protein D9M72_204120 [compost metagenome]